MKIFVVFITMLSACNLLFPETIIVEISPNASDDTDNTEMDMKQEFGMDMKQELDMDMKQELDIKPELCGNGSIDDGEDCDDQELTQTCTSLLAGSGELRCENCRFDTSDCKLSFIEISAGWGDVCVLKSDHSAICWGSNEWAQNDVPKGEKFLSIKTGGNHACGIKLDHTLLCWGEGKRKQLNAPKGEFEKLSVGNYHSCAIDAKGGLKCWGGNEESQLVNTTGAKHVSAGAELTCRTTDIDSIECNGRKAVSKTGPYLTVSTGAEHVCALDMNENIQCWGDDHYKQVTNIPTGEFTTISAGFYCNCAIKKGTKEIHCWGRNHTGQCDAPTGRYKLLATGSEVSCAVSEKDVIKCWGNPSNKRLVPPTL